MTIRLDEFFISVSNKFYEVCLLVCEWVQNQMGLSEIKWFISKKEGERPNNPEPLLKDNA